MWTLIVFMTNGNETTRDFFTKDEAIDYARQRKMQDNKCIKRHIIKPKKFADWLQERGLNHAGN